MCAYATCDKFLCKETRQLKRFKSRLANAQNKHATFFFQTFYFSLNATVLHNKFKKYLDAVQINLGK